MADWMQERKEKRFYQEFLAEEEISERTYNVTLGGVLLYGLLFNIGICYFCTDFALSLDPLVLLLGYFVCCIAGTVISAKSNNAIISFLGYNLVVIPVGLVVSICVYAYGGMSSEPVVQAFLITMLATGFMVAFSIYKPEFFSKLGGLLMVCLLGLIVAEVVLMLLRVEQIWTAWFGAILFSFYIGYDYYKAQAYPKTLDNAVDSALDIYLDIINLFLKILRILGSKGGNSNSRRR